ncbi:MAG: glycosyltransferase family 2 protein [Chloroflexota bacterium]|nr:glycosyltransferase family 2 protein [Chloroflexota bacterium]
MNTQFECSVVVPVYNSAATLPELIARLGQVLPQVAPRFEVVLINDGSRDQSWKVICELAHQNDWVRGINLSRNFGQHNALLAGIRAARGGIVVTMDDDLQHPPDEIPKLLNTLLEGYDVVYGTPQTLQHGLWRDFSSQLIKLILQGAMGVRAASGGSSFRAFRTDLRDAFADYTSPYVAIDVLLAWGTTRFGATPVRHDPRRVGKSTYNLLKLIVLAIDLTTGFSTWPLRVASLIGFGVTLLGLVALAYVLGRYLITDASVSIFQFFTAVLAIFSGAQLFALGIIGEYLARMYFRVMARPTYVVREQTEQESHLKDAQHV